MEFLLWLQEIRVPAVEYAAFVISLLCDKILIISIFCYIFWCVDKKSAYGLAFSFVLSGITVQGIKILAGIERPFVLNPEIKPYNPALETATGYSFPSAHTQTAASLLGYTAFSSGNKIIKILSFLLVFLVMLSRMILGVHTLYDVSAAFVITIAIVWLVKQLQKKDSEKVYRIVSSCGIFLSVLALGYAIFAIKSGKSSYGLVHDCIVVSVCSITFFVCRLIETRFIDFDTSDTFSGRKNLFSQIFKYVIGMAGLLIIYFVLGIFDNPYADCAKYIAVFSWIGCVYPLCIRKISRGSSI